MGGKSYDTYNAVKAVCPFYKGEDRLDVRCEGLVPGGTLVNRFRFPRPKDRYMLAHCQNMQGYKTCVIHAILMTKYMP